MPRPLRILYPNACYHVMNRGAGRQKIFKNNHHRTIFINLLQECRNLYNINIYAYCLMDNHYHLIISTPDSNISRVMRHINGVYTQKYNRLMKRDGPLFRGRYHAKLIEEDCYLLLVTRYIHLNPVDAGIVQNPADYRWSSYRAYLGLTAKSDWLSIQTITEQLRQTNSLSHIINYKDYVENRNIEEINIFKSIKHTSPIIGSISFKKKSLEKINPLHIKPCSSDISRAKTRPSIELIMENVCSFYGIDHTFLINTKSGTKNIYKRVFIYICKIEFGHTLASIASCVGFTRYESVSLSISRFKKELKKSRNLVNQVQSIITRINTILLTS